MAHVGKLYPLSKFRSLNADAPYPRWAANKIVVAMPGGSGSLAAFLSNRAFVSDAAVYAGGGLIWDVQFPIIPLGLEVIIRTFTIWTNADPNPRQITTQLIVTQIFPPFVFDVAVWSNTFPFNKHLQSAAMEEVTNVTPSLFNPSGDVTWRALTWAEL